MSATQKEITAAVDSTIISLINLFQNEPTRFFTENDLVCCFVRLLHNSLDLIDATTAPDIDDLPHNLIHCEYATAYRCDMKDKTFTQKLDSDVTLKTGRFRRGHHDVVVLNPTFIRQHPFNSLKGQTYDLVKESVLPKLTETEPAILFGIEFVYRRSPIKRSRSGGWEAAAIGFVADVIQDADKLKSSVEAKHVMKKARMLAFLKGTTDEGVLSFIGRSLANIKHVTLVTAD